MDSSTMSHVDDFSSHAGLTDWPVVCNAAIHEVSSANFIHGRMGTGPADPAATGPI